MQRLRLIVTTPIDLILTLILWLYFTVGALLFFLPWYLFAYIFTHRVEESFQRINYRFIRSFLRLMVIVLPRLRLDIAPELKNLNSAIVVSNHVSYLDPLLLVGLFPRQTTIVKGLFTRVPIFGWFLRKSGYIPFFQSATIGTPFIEEMDNLVDYLNSGGVLFIFPEGTRGRTGAMKKMHKGAVSLAKRCQVPLELVYISNSDELFRPGHFLFNTCASITIGMHYLGRIALDKEGQWPSARALLERVEERYQEHIRSQDALKPGVPE